MHTCTSWNCAVKAEVEYTIDLQSFECWKRIVLVWKWRFWVLWDTFLFKKWKNIREFLLTRGYRMREGISQWFKSSNCCFNWIIILFWSGISFALLWLSVKLSYAIFALCQIYSRCCASGYQTDLNSVTIFLIYYPNFLYFERCSDWDSVVWLYPLGRFYSQACALRQQK